MEPHRGNSVIVSENSTLNNIEPHWNFPPVTQLTSALLTLIFNATLLLVFALEFRSLTPFRVYIVNLVFTNFVVVMSKTPANLLHSLFDNWIFGGNWCTLYVYGVYVAAAVQNHCHLLLTINRVWAASLPLHYRSQHTLKIAVLLCGGTWLYVYILTLPAILVDAAWYRYKLGPTVCLLNVKAQYNWAIAIEFLLYDMPIALMVIAYFFLLYKQRIHQLAKRRLKQSEDQKPTQTEKGLTIINGGTATVDRQVTVTKTTRVEGQRAFILLTLMTISIVICWTPGTMYFTTLLFVSYRPSPVWLHVGNTLWAMQPVMDPVLIVLTFRDIREAFTRRLGLGSRWRG